MWPEDQVMHRGRKTRPPPVLGGSSPLSNESKKKISALVVVVVVVARLLDAVVVVVVARHLLDAVVVVVAEITNSHLSPSPAPSWGPSPRSSPSPSCLLRILLKAYPNPATTNIVTLITKIHFLFCSGGLAPTRSRSRARRSSSPTRVSSSANTRRGTRPCSTVDR